MTSWVPSLPAIFWPTIFWLVSWEYELPNIWDIKNVPNHQPVLVSFPIAKPHAICGHTSSKPVKNLHIWLVMHWKKYGRETIIGLELNGPWLPKTCGVPATTNSCHNRPCFHSSTDDMFQQATEANKRTTALWRAWASLRSKGTKLVDGFNPSLKMIVDWGNDPLKRANMVYCILHLYHMCE